MKNNLLSIFPLHDSASYARVVLTKIDDCALPPLQPFTLARAQLADLFLQVPIDATQVLTALDRGATVQLPVSNDDALLIACCHAITH